ncbi:hypothetical protein PHLGIDRAFT_204806 [Phlebiopsis gigantea 11061_1 CR5-6]|uniref:Uncharacterized protein n=1 Tax=Phlebiopsis gigantea (strain 11061_1 CR5-6) TaxID=745531 RepID=A0A0C3NH97_PHLG1|nr:hypothetical protein PHLGIDRAFT_204806 [Phlebiopsis gigantea 11061_1 CR5-6]
MAWCTAVSLTLYRPLLCRDNKVCVWSYGRPQLKSCATKNPKSSALRRRGARLERRVHSSCVLRNSGTRTGARICPRSYHTLDIMPLCR